MYAADGTTQPVHTQALELPKHGLHVGPAARYHLARKHKVPEQLGKLPGTGRRAAGLQAPRHPLGHHGP